MVACSSEESVPEDPVGIVYAPSLGPPSLNEVVYHADVIARVTLKGTEAAAELHYTNADGSKVFRGLVKFNFNALEYLKGSGGSELTAYATVDLRSEVILGLIHSNAKGEFINPYSVDWGNPYATMEGALAAAQKWEKDRNTQWDDLDAIILITQEAVPGTTHGSNRYSLSRIHYYPINFGSKVWLPSTASSSGASGSAAARFMVEFSPPSSGSAVGASGSALAQPATISVAEMKTLIAKMDKWRKDGERVEDYLKCIENSFQEQRIINGKIQRGESLRIRTDFSLGSGLPTASVRYKSVAWPGVASLAGRDKNLFEVWPHIGSVRAVRPLPAGEYRFYHNFRLHTEIICDYQSVSAKNNAEWVVTVTAPAGTLHEAFFDPIYATSTGEYKADASNGVLKPAAYRKTGDTATTTIHSIAWKAQQATLTTSPGALPANHHVDFIELDGTVSLRLDVDTATTTTSGGKHAHAWRIYQQPWHAGDKLMLRISQSGAN